MADDAIRKRRSERARAELWKIWGPSLAVVAIGFGLAIASLDPPPPRALTIAAGAREGAYHAFAERYRDVLAAEGVALTILETAGSIENIAHVKRGEAHIALVQGGTVGAGQAAGLESLASVFLEPVWVFLGAELGDVARLGALAGRRLAVGAEGSGTRALALTLLAANGVDRENATLVPASGRQAADALRAGTVDAAFFVASPSAGYLPALLRDNRLRLLPIERRAAYQRRFAYLAPLDIGEGLLDLEANLPAHDVAMLATAASVVATKDLHRGLVPLLLPMLAKVHGAGGLLEPAGAFPSADLVSVALRTEARQFLVNGPSFLHRVLPFGTASAIDRMKILLLPLLTLLIPVFKAAPPLYRWRVRRKIYRWYDDLRLADEAIRGDGQTAITLDAEQAVALDADLRRLEDEVSGVSVPLSYMDEYYHLRLHIQMMRDKVDKVRAHRAA